MKIRSKSLSTLLFAATCAVTSLALLPAAPTQAANLLKTTYPGSIGGNWDGFATPQGGSVFIKDGFRPPTILGQTYEISVDASAGTSSGSALDITKFQLSLVGGVTAITTVFDNYADRNTTKTFIGNGSPLNLFFEYQFKDTVTGRAELNLSIDEVATPAQAPEPLTIIGTIIGGTAAIRMRNRLKASNKKVFSVGR